MTTRRDLIFRVFVSSTFGDLVEERNALRAKGGPFDNLRKYCEERGARFQDIDLRWGVSAEAGLDQQTMNICLQELARCQEVSPKPNFILLLGNRYGWRPLPAQIDAGEFEQLIAQVPQTERGILHTGKAVAAWREDKPLARVGWYRKDENADPSLYVLQHRLIDLPSGALDDDRKRAGQAERDDWTQLEKRMRILFTDAIMKLGWLQNDQKRFKYEASATHQEIRAGALVTEDMKEHVFCYFRDIDGLPVDQTAAVYRDISEGAADRDAESRLEALKVELGGDGPKAGKLPPEHVHKYRAWWRGNGVEFDRRDLCADVERDLKDIIGREIAAFRQKPTLERERETHREFAAERCRHFVGRQEILENIHSYLASDKSRPLVIHGKSGSGKTALMAKAIAECVVQNPDSAIISRFIGATPGSSDLRTLLGDLCRELGVAEVPQDMNDLVRTFRAQLSLEQAGDKKEENKPQVKEQGKIVLFLDALDQLNATDNARMLYWLPRELKPNVKLIVSVLENEGTSAGKVTVPNSDSSPKSAIKNPQSSFSEDPYDLARRIWPQSLLEVGNLEGKAAGELLDKWLIDAGRKLQDDQRAEVIGKFAQCPLPLYLKLACREAFRWRSWEGVPEPLSNTVEGILAQWLQRLERPENHGEVLVRRALGYLAAAKNGLTEQELLDVLSRKESGVIADFVKRSPESPKEDRLPVIVWSRLFADMRGYMTERRADGTVVMDFYHRQVGEAVRKRYLATEEARIQAHLHLADYFDTLDFWAESLEAQRARAKRLPPTPRPANVRKVVELPYHRLEVAKLAGKDDPKSEYWDKVADLLTNWQFLEAKAEADPNFQEQEALEKASRREESLA